MYQAHINEINGEVQTVKEHLECTAKLCREYSIVPFKNIAEAIGKLHDIGKYQPSFQKKIDGNSSIKIEHSICGAKEAEELYRSKEFSVVRCLMEYCIAGHHSGIPNGGNRNDSPEEGTLYGRLGRTTEDYSAYKDEIILPEINEKVFNNYLSEDCRTREDIIEKFAFLTRYCFSCLTDADSNDTAKFCGGAENIELPSDFESCLWKINQKFEGFVCTTELQKCRSKIQRQVYEKTAAASEIFLMNMPTGSGKTLCSMKFALERAIGSGKRRIIYVIPYNSIIDQIAEEFDDLFGDSAVVLRDQSSFSYDDIDFDEDYKKVIKNSAENWNAQIIITTAVQFFESLHKNKRNKLRKMHNMSDSILIFDEAHLMPENYLQPCLKAVAYLTKLLNSEAVFLTATMPDFEGLIKKYALENSKVTNLVEDRSDFNKFQKCSFQNDGAISAEELVQRAMQLPSALIVVNRRKTAREIFKLYTGTTFHLSTYMTAYDRKNTIHSIKEALAALERDYPDLQNVPDDRRITVVSTSLIEAGVDLDFYGVFRELQGLDSILQAGGRCNREGKRKREDAMVHIFTLEKGKATTRTNLTKGLIADYDDISSPECIKEYYRRLFSIDEEEITKNTISNHCEDVRTIPFKDYAENFKMIDSPTVSVVAARDDESERLVDELRAIGRANGYVSSRLRRKLQKYTFTVYNYEFEDLKSQHAVDDFGSGIWCLTAENYYDESVGVLFEASDYVV